MKNLLKRMMSGLGAGQSSEGNSAQPVARRGPRWMYYAALFAAVLIITSIPEQTCQGQTCTRWQVTYHCINGGATIKCGSDHSGCYDCGYPSCPPGGYTSDGCQCIAATQPDNLSVSGSVNCAASGASGWCRGSASIALTATDSLGHAVGFTGSIGGSSFTCGAPCTKSLPEGQGNISYMGRCAGNQTASGTASWKLDLGAPLVLGTISGGNLGENTWYLSGPIALACTGSDGLSGLAGISYGEQSASSDGYHTLSCTASDVAGNQASFSHAVKIDGTPPVITATVGGGTLHDNGWYTGTVALSCQATDATSGVAGITYGVQSAEKDGETTLSCEATDVAGNKADSSTTVRIDNTAPAASFQYSGNICPSGWYNSPVEVSLTSSDAGSGVAADSFSQDDGKTWKTDARLGSGVNHLVGQATDKAGNTSSITGIVLVDVKPPQTEWSIAQGAWVAGRVTLQGKSTDDLAGVSAVEVSADDGNTWVPVGTSGDWTFAWDTTTVPDGAYTLLARATDKACNAEHTGQVTLHVDNTPPEITLEDPFVPVGKKTNVESRDAGSGLDRGQAAFSGNGIEPRVMAFSSLKGMDSLAWDGTDANGQLAPYGIYTVKVDIWDRVGNHTSTQGKWIRVRPGAAVEAGLAFPMIAIAAWLLAMCAALLRDGRWKELRGLHTALAGYRMQTHWHNRGEDDD